MKRRDFLTKTVTGAAAYGALGGLPDAMVRAAPNSAAAHETAPLQTLEIVKRVIEVNGKPANVLGLYRPDGQPGLVLDADTAFNVQLSSQIDQPTLIHWHGLTPPWDQDGVPDNPAAPIKPGENRAYNFHLGAGGTHWMHAHTLQEQSLLAAPLIVRTAEDKKRDEQEVVVLLHDFSFKTPEELLAGLRKPSDSTATPHDMTGMDMTGMDMGGMSHDAGGSGMAMGNASSMTGMDMPAMDINDIDYDAYLANDRTLDDPEVFQVEKGGRVRLRLINGAAATAFTIDTGKLDAKLVAVDGQDVQPIPRMMFPVSMGQRLDILLQIPKEGGTFPVLALREGARERTGVVLSTVGANISKVAPVGETAGPLVGLDLEMRLKPTSLPAERHIDKSFTLSLTGDMAKYSWGISGDPLTVFPGDRVEIAIRNGSMMSHPMHLHGHHFQVTQIEGRKVNGALRDTVLIPSLSQVSIVFDAHNPGRWPLHCHHLYHMVSGMMTYVGYEA